MEAILIIEIYDRLRSRNTKVGANTKKGAEKSLAVATDGSGGGSRRRLN